MNVLRDRLDDLLTDIPHDVVPDIASARAAGDHRRRVRRGLGAAALVAAVAVVAGVVGVGRMVLPAPQPADGQRSTAVSGYPERVTAPWWITKLPRHNEPLAGLVEVDSGAWFALGERGQIHRLDFVYTGSGNFPSLSPDGTKIAYVGHDWRVAIRDVVTGDVVSFPTVSGGKEIPGATLFWTAQAPAAWSPDGTDLVVQGGPLRGRDTTYGNVILTVDGTVTPVAAQGSPAGWLDPDHALLYNGDGSLISIDRAGQQAAVVPLDGLERRGQYNQFSPMLTADGQTFLLTRIGDISGLATTSRWNPETGEPLPRTIETREISTWCPSSRTPTTITLASGGYDSALTMHPVGGGRSLVEIDPALEPTCLVLADEALAGKATGSLVDRVVSGISIGPIHTPDLRDTWVSWHLRYAAPLLAGMVLILATRRLVRRRRDRLVA